MNGRLVAVGAVLGGAVALATTLVFDPAEGTGSSAAVLVGSALDTASEGKPDERVDKQARIDFIAGCTDTARANGAPEHAIRPYCECMYSTIAREERLDVLASDPPAEPPAWLLRIAEDCASA